MAMNKAYIQGLIKRHPNARRENNDVKKSVAKFKTMFRSISKVSQLVSFHEEKLNYLSSKGLYSIICSCGAV